MPVTAAAPTPGCEAVTVQFPVLLTVTVAEDTPLPSMDELPTEQGPEALKLTSCIFGELLE